MIRRIALLIAGIAFVTNAQTLSDAEEKLLAKHREEELNNVLEKYKDNTITSQDGIKVRLTRGSDFVIQRAVVQETRLSEVDAALTSLDSAIMQKSADSFNAMTAAVIERTVQNAVINTKKFIGPLQTKANDLEAAINQLEQTSKNLGDKIVKDLDAKADDLQDDITKTLNDFKSDSKASLDSAMKEVNTSIKTVTDSLGKVRLDADSLACNSGTNGVMRLTGSDFQICDGSKWKPMGSGGATTYTNWGTDTCKGKEKKGVTQVYSGFTWGGYHDHRGGAEPICLKSGGGRNGAGADGDDSQNLMYPLRIEGPSPQNGNIRNDRLIRCAVCKIEKHCYLDSGINGCGSTEYEAIYSGSFYGGYHGHHSKNKRICLDKVGKYDNSNGYGSYMYPTKIKENFDGRSSESFIHCHQCCKK